ncbi:MAG: hypothetical protein C6P37_12690 [Caldibacillus debilis]|uniref:Uncharacterized protein n=1 Tax=Caldibacillus debilis TaxID=301148 RepID=A0A3E0K2G8_9BACI|nr:MAG: hypothetical protein C6P37_12690 [Caldibacillus debilis]
MCGKVLRRGTDEASVERENERFPVIDGIMRRRTILGQDEPAGSDGGPAAGEGNGLRVAVCPPRRRRSGIGFVPLFPVSAGGGKGRPPLPRSRDAVSCGRQAGFSRQGPNPFLPLSAIRA